MINIGQIIDREDRQVLATIAVVFVSVAVALFAIALMLGLALRIFQQAGGV